MSAQLIDLAWKQPVKLTPKMILVWMAQHAVEGQSGAPWCCPTIGALVVALGVSAPTVYNALNVLERQGLVKREHRPHASNLYRLHLPGTVQ